MVKLRRTAPPEVHPHVAIISDTHGRLDEKLKRLFRKASLLVHAGDLHDEATLAAVQHLVPGSPALIVRGNNDKGAFAANLPEVAHVDVQGVRILAAHTAEAAEAALADEQHARARVVVVGHSHRPGADVKDHRLWINPGSAGPKRFSLPRAAALLEIRPDELVARIYALEEPGFQVLTEARLTTAP